MSDSMKRNILSVVVLTVICAVVAALLAAVNMLTLPEIDKRNAEKVAESLKVVMPEGEFGSSSDPIKEGAPSTVREVYTDKNGGGHVVILVTNKGYTGKEIGITVGIGADGKIIKAVVTKNEESIIPPDLKPFGSYGNAYSGVSSEGLADLVTGATVRYTEAAIKNAINDAFVYLGYSEGGSDIAPDDGAEQRITSPKTEEEIKAAASAFFDGGSVTFTDKTPAEKYCPKNLIKLYSTDSGSYVAYVVTVNSYSGTVATEGLVLTDGEGNILETKLLTWKVGHDHEGPGNFADRFAGKDYWHLDEVELVSGATGTSTDFLGAVYDAVEVITGLVYPRSEEKLLSLVDELVPNSGGFEAVELPADAPDTLVRLYKDLRHKGHVAYIVTKGYTGAVATEALVYFDRDARIKEVKLLTWTVGHGVGPGDFISGFVGRTEKDIEEVELVTAATGTSGDLRTAIAAAFPYAPAAFPTPLVVGIAVFVLAAGAFISLMIISRRRRAAK